MINKFNLFDKNLETINVSKLLITTLNAHCYNITRKDAFFREALLKSDILIPDGISMVWATRWLKNEKIKKIAGADLFYYELNRLANFRGKCFFLGSSDETLQKITQRLNREFPTIQVQTYSPPFKQEFTPEDDAAMLSAINQFQPDVLMIGMTAPKQEKWAYRHYNELQAGHICCIGAVFDFYAGTINRAPGWMIDLGLEWLFRLIKEPRRMWRRYLIGNIKFIGYMIGEKIATR
mgnify:CR=1 FL=1